MQQNYIHVDLGGGSVLQTVTQTNAHRLPESTVRKFEDGTPNFLGILSIQYGFEALEEVGGMTAITKHTNTVTKYLYDYVNECERVDMIP